MTFFSCAVGAVATLTLAPPHSKQARTLERALAVVELRAKDAEAAAELLKARLEATVQNVRNSSSFHTSPGRVCNLKFDRPV